MGIVIKNKIYTGFFLLLYIFFLFFICSKFSPLYNFNDWSDINIYFTIGKGIWFDKVIYKDLFDHKGPLIFFIYSIGYLFSNNSYWGMFIVQVLVQFIAIYFIYLSIRLFVRRNLALALSLLSPVFILIYSMNGGAAEEFVYVCEAVSLYYLLKYLNVNEAKHPFSYMVIHGAMFCLVFFIKMNLVIFWFFPIFIIGIILLINKLYKSFFINIIAFFIGISLILLPLLSYFLFNDALSDLWKAYFEFNILYGKPDILSVKDFILGIAAISYRTVKWFYISLSLIFIGIILFIFVPVAKSKYSKVIIFLSALSLFLVIITTRVLLSFYIIPITIFSVFFCISVGYLLEKIYLSSRDIKFSVLIISFVFCLSLGIYQKRLFGYSVSDLLNRNFPSNEVNIFSSEMSKDKNPTLLVAGIKKGIPIYTILNIVPNTKYFFFPNIHHEVYPDIRDEQTSYIEEKLVDYVVLYDSFRYYEYYKELLSKDYKVQIFFDDPVGKIYLYKKRF